MAVISSLQSGIPLNSTGNPLKSGEVTIADASGFFPIYNNTTGQLMTGGAFLTVQVGPGTPGAINTVIAGQALTLSVEYNSLGQFRFDVYPKGAKVMLKARKVAFVTLSQIKGITRIKNNVL